MRSFAKTTTAAAATTGSLFALPHHAEATIVYSGLQNLTASIHGNGYSFPRIPGLQGMRLVLGRDPMFGFNNAALSGIGPSYQVAGYVLKNGSNQLKKLASGAAITAVPHKSASGNLVFFQHSVQQNGTWAKSQTGFAAFQLANGDLGWIRLEWTNTLGDNGVDNLIALDWAYNDQAGQSITTPIESAPEPSRALLALAGVGAMALRRRRKAA